MVYHDQSIVRLMWNLALSVFAGEKLRNKYSLYWPGSLWYGSSFRYGTKPFYHRAISFDGRRRIELSLLRSGTLLWRSALCWLWLLRVFLEQCEWLHSKMRAHYLEGDESLWLHLPCTNKGVTVEKIGGSQVFHFQGGKTVGGSC